MLPYIEFHVNGTLSNERVIASCLIVIETRHHVFHFLTKPSFTNSSMIVTSRDSVLCSFYSSTTKCCFLHFYQSLLNKNYKYTFNVRTKFKLIKTDIYKQPLIHIIIYAKFMK